jgi:hypothetical protein
LFETGRRTEAVIALVAIGIGVFWSNGLAYSNAWLAPRSQLVELQRIDQRFAGDGPALMTEYQPYGVRHFLRNLDPEAASERRHRVVLLRGGGYLAPGQTADLDAFELDAISVYRTLVLRRSPVESRPPAIYRLVWKGQWYEVWQRPEQPRKVIEHLSLGNALDPASVPACADALRLATTAQNAGGVLAAVARPASPLELDLTQSSHPAAWVADPRVPGTLVPHGGGTASFDTTVTHGGRYGIWLGGSFRRTITALVDGHQVGSLRHQLNNTGQWTPLGKTRLTAGTHHVELRYGGSRLAPGSGGFPFAMGPLVLSTETADLPVTLVPSANARSLCGQRLDWLEALGP